MEIKIHSQHMELSAAQKEAIEAKCSKLAQFANRVSDDSSEIRDDVAHEASKRPEDAYVCKLTLFVPHDTLRAEARDSSLENAVDDVLEKIKAPIEHYKDKTHHISERH